MSQLDGNAIQEVQKLAIAGLSIGNIDATECPTALIPQNAQVEVVY